EPPAWRFEITREERSCRCPGSSTAFLQGISNIGRGRHGANAHEKIRLSLASYHDSQGDDDDDAHADNGAGYEPYGEHGADLLVLVVTVKPALIHTCGVEPYVAR